VLFRSSLGGNFDQEGNSSGELFAVGQLPEELLEEIIADFAVDVTQAVPDMDPLSAVSSLGPVDNNTDNDFETIFGFGLDPFKPIKSAQEFLNEGSQPDLPIPSSFLDGSLLGGVAPTASGTSLVEQTQNEFQVASLGDAAFGFLVGSNPPPGEFVVPLSGLPLPNGVVELEPGGPVPFDNGFLDAVTQAGLLGNPPVGPGVVALGGSTLTFGDSITLPIGSYSVIFAGIDVEVVFRTSGFSPTFAFAPGSFSVTLTNGTNTLEGDPFGSDFFLSGSFTAINGSGDGFDFEGNLISGGSGNNVISIIGE